MGTDRLQCPQNSKIIQRGAANLFLPELVSALTIPPRASRLHRLLEIQAIRVILQIQSIPIPTKGRLLEILDGLVQRRDIGQGVRDEINTFDEPVLLEAVQDIRGAPIDQTEVTLRRDEFTALHGAATNGYPRDPHQGTNYEFEVVRNHVRFVPGPQGRMLRITPVSRLRVVMVQTGYRRLDPLAQPVDRVVTLSDRSWYPGVELFGEGIYVDLAPADHEELAPHFQLEGAEVRRWTEANRDQQAYFNDLKFSDPQWTHPVFVWWHTLSHRLIAALSMDCGYSSAALRERVFISAHPRTGDLSGGVLIYTAQPGGDGTLGGLIAMVPSFERVLQRAFLDVDSCSNDPLCSENHFVRGKVNGPACYSCLLQSETSCEHRNMLLDRALLLRNLP
jgi:hypothetical protein